MKPLTTTDLIKKAAFHEQVFYRWYRPEFQGQPESAWQVKAEGHEPVQVAKRQGTQNRSSKHLFTVGQFSFGDYYPVEEGFELDGHGFVYFFNSSEEADQYFKERRFVEKVQSLLEAIDKNLGGARIHFVE